MKAYIPRQLLMEYKESVGHLNTPILDSKTGRYVRYGVITQADEVDVPSYFIENKGGYDNTVVHAKFVGEDPVSDVPILDCKLSDGNWFHNGANTTHWQGGTGFANSHTRYYYFRTPEGRFWSLYIWFWTSIYADRMKPGGYLGHHPLFIFRTRYYDENRKKVQKHGFALDIIRDSSDYGTYVTASEWLKPLAVTMQDQCDEWCVEKFSTSEKCFDAWLSEFWPYMKGLYYYTDGASYGEDTWKYTLTERSYSKPSLETVRGTFMFHEPEIFAERVDPVLLGVDTDFSGYWRDWLTQHAFLDACQNLPRLSDNSIANIAELCSFIYNLVVKHQIEIPKSLSEAWLAYRYQFSTGKADAEEAIEFVHRHMDLGSLDKGMTSYGTATKTYNGTSVLCRCEVVTTPRELGTISRIWRTLYTYGLQPNFYVLWDSVPYSFIVDWFIPVGDVASVLDAERMYTSGVYYDFRRICYSLSYERTIKKRRYRCYTRWPGSVPSSLNEWYWLDRPDASHKTVGYRILDTLSLLVTHKRGG